MELPAGSVEYVHVPITSTRPLEDVVVEFAFVAPSSRPGAGDWRPAEFHQGVARRLTEATPTPARFDVWVRITASPETVIRRAGRLVFT